MSKQYTKTNILYIESGQAGGGSFGSLFLLLKYIDKNRFNPVVIYLNQTHWIDEVKDLNIPVYLIKDRRYSLNTNKLTRRYINRFGTYLDKQFSFIYMFFIYFAHYPTIHSIKKIARDHQIDIIHLNNQINRDLFGVISSKKLKVSCVSHLRSHRSENFGSIRANFANKYVSKFIAASKNVGAHWIDCGVDSKKVSVVYNGIQKTVLKPVNLYSRFNIDQSNCFIFGSVGTLNEIKGHTFLINVFFEFSKLHPDAYLIIVGDGPMRESIQNQILRLDLHNKILLTGFQKDAINLISSFDTLILPSKNENCSRVLLEAMSAGTPIIASDVGGNPELIRHRYNGLLASFGNINSFVSKMEYMIMNPHNRIYFSENGINKVNKIFTVERYISSIQKIYHKI